MYLKRKCTGAMGCAILRRIQYVRHRLQNRRQKITCCLPASKTVARVKGPGLSPASERDWRERS